MLSLILLLQCSVLFSEFFTVSANKKDVWFQHRLMPGVEYYVSSQKMSNSYAGAFCQANGAHLASISSKNENQFVSRMLANLRMRDKVWIGAQRNLSGSQVKPFSWTWQDGSPFTIFQDYVTCARGKNCLWREHVLSNPTFDGPNNERGNEYCIATAAVVYSISSKPSKARLGPWRDEQCKQTYPFVCKRQLKTVSCPANSNGISVTAGCSCNAGYSGIVSATTTAPFYTSTCTACTAVPFCAVALTCTMSSDSRCTSCTAPRQRVVGGAGVMDQCNNAVSVFGSFGGWTFYKVGPINGVMSDNNIIAACAAAGLRVPCAGAAGCKYNNNQAQCVITSEVGCGNPMQSLSHAICGGANPNWCPALTNSPGTVTFMGNAWSGGMGCGTLNGGWCTSNTNNGFTICV